MNKKFTILFLILLVLSSVIHNCKSDPSKKTETLNTNNNGYNESFRKTGWINETKYRAVIYIITNDECKKSSLAEIEEKIKFEAYKNLQNELNPSFNRNASIQIKALADNSGKMIKIEKDCTESNIYFYDIEKNDLKSDFEKIKNLK